MNLVRIVTRDKSSMFQRVKTRDFEYDETEVSFPVLAGEYVELLLMMNHSFTVEFFTEARERIADIGNAIICRVSGYGALVSAQSPEETKP